MTSTQFLQYLVQKYDWVIHVVIFLLMFYVVIKTLHINAPKLIEIFFSEFRSLGEGIGTMGAVNALGVIAVFIFGIFVIVAFKFEETMAFLSSKIPPQSLSALHKSAQFDFLFYCFAGMVLVSVVCVFVDNKKR